jgi:hypothetical protein
MSYPTSPTNGQIYGNKKFNSTKGVWEQSPQIPVGFIYTQFPGKLAPADAFGGTWIDVTTTYAGAFFRAEGGNASTFGAGLQAGQNKAHTHTGRTGGMSANETHTHIGNGTYGTGAGDTPRLGNVSSTYNYINAASVAHTHNSYCRF